MFEMNYITSLDSDDNSVDSKYEEYTESFEWIVIYSSGIVKNEGDVTCIYNTESIGNYFLTNYKLAIF